MVARFYRMSRPVRRVPQVNQPAEEAGDNLPAAEPRDAAEPVECPECGGPSTTAALGRWGNCRACRTAQSRLTDPLRW